MKLRFKNLVIIFLVALLGAGVGVIGASALYNKTDIFGKDNKEQYVLVNQVQYANKSETDYTIAIDKAFNTVVEIETTAQTTSSSYFYFGSDTTTSTLLGSGVIVSQDGYIVTNEHVISGAYGDDPVKVKLYNGETYSADIVGYDVKTDLAVLKIDANDLQYANFADSSQLVMGEDVIAIGNPLGLGISCSNGIISALEKEIYINNVYMSVIQTNAAVNSGNSGGGLFDINGNIVGIVNAKNSSSSSTTTVEGMGYAIPSNTVIKIMNELIENGYVKDRASLGIKVYTGSSTYTSQGVIVTDVIEGGGAQKAGIQAKDIIISIDDVVVSSYADLSKALDTKTVGQTVKVTISRDNKQMDFDVTLQQASAN